MKQPAWEPVDASVTIVGESTPVLELRDESQHAGDRVVLDAGHGRRSRRSSTSGRERRPTTTSAPVAGKIVLADGGVGRVFAEAVQKRGAVGVLAYNMPAYTQPEMHRTRFSSAPCRTTAVKKSWGMPISRDALDRLRARAGEGSGHACASDRSRRCIRRTS